MAPKGHDVVRARQGRVKGARHDAFNDGPTVPEVATVFRAGVLRVIVHGAISDDGRRRAFRSPDGYVAAVLYRAPVHFVTFRTRRADALSFVDATVSSRVSEAGHIPYEADAGKLVVVASVRSAEKSRLL